MSKISLMEKKKEEKGSSGLQPHTLTVQLISGETNVKTKIWNHFANEIICQLCLQTRYNDAFGFAGTIA